jgi:hypothetical protein
VRSRRAERIDARADPAARGRAAPDRNARAIVIAVRARAVRAAPMSILT